MIVKQNCYVITTKENPIMFDADSALADYSEGEFTEYIEDAFLYSNEEAARNEIDGCFDDPNLYKIIPVKLTYEF